MPSPRTNNPQHPTETSNRAPASDPVEAALVNRDSIMRSLEEQRNRMFEIFERQKQIAMGSMPTPSGDPRPALPAHYLTPITQPATSHSLEDKRRQLQEAVAALAAFHGDSGERVRIQREQAAGCVADALSDLIAAEVAQRQHR